MMTSDRFASSSRGGVPVFGEHAPGQRCVVRPSAYAVIQDAAGRLAIAVEPLGRFLPGGGLEPGETPEAAVVREALEECGLVVEPGERIAEAVQLVYASDEGICYEKPSVFLRAVVAGASATPLEPPCALLWLDLESAERTVTPASHAHAVRMACRHER